MTNFAIDTLSPKRLGLITGSRCTPLFPKRDAEKGMKTLAMQLANEKYWGYVDEVTTWQMEHGKLAEHFGIEHFRRHIDPTIKEGRFIQKGECGGTTDAECEGYGVDIKSPTSLQKWTEYLYYGISDEQFNQCQMYMYLTGFRRWVIAAFLIETNFMSDNGLIYPVDEDKRMICVDVYASDEWVEKLHPQVEKVVLMREDFVSKLERKFGKRNG
jgi:hypothetical protein